MRAVMTKMAREGVPDIVSRKKLASGSGPHRAPGQLDSRVRGNDGEGAGMIPAFAGTGAGTAPQEQTRSSPRYSNRGPGHAVRAAQDTRVNATPSGRE